ncbi:hypothetical protein MRX96_001643 [Rhipicephalus microplus]
MFAHTTKGVPVCDACFSNRPTHSAPCNFCAENEVVVAQGFLQVVPVIVCTVTGEGEIGANVPAHTVADPGRKCGIRKRFKLKIFSGSRKLFAIDIRTVVTSAFVESVYVTEQ